MSGTRMFAAVVPPPEVVEHLDAFLEVRRAAAPFRWASAAQLHLTLAFYADVPDRAQDELVERLERAAERRTPFGARIAGGGAFPHVAGARVLWAGLVVDDADELDRLSAGARAAASRAGVAVDGQRFRPHVTLARLGSPADVSAWVEVLDAYDGPVWTVDTVTLLASYLGEGPRGRPRYEVVAELPVG